jgi:hypothetical protein
MAKSAVPNEAAFVAPPPGAPPYYGFPILEDVVVEGFVLGMITNFEAERCDRGDAFVVAPYGSRAGIVWNEGDSMRVSQVLPAEPTTRWGVWEVSFVHPMTNRENARRNLQAIVPILKQEWERWRNQKASREP